MGRMEMIDRKRELSLVSTSKGLILGGGWAVGADHSASGGWPARKDWWGPWLLGK